MRQIILVLILCVLAIVSKGNNPDPTYSSSTYVLGIRTLSVLSLNNALKNEGLAEIKPFASNGCIGGTFWHKKFVFNGNITFLGASGVENSNITRFWGWGFSLDFGRPIWSNDKMFLYPYFTLTYMVPFIKTMQKTDAKSFSAVYNQPLVERSFDNNGELDGALGLAYRVKIGKKQMLDIGGGYHFPLLRSKWRYIEKKIDFPKIDCRGWVVGITWSHNVRQKSTGSSSQSL